VSVRTEQMVWRPRVVVEKWDADQVDALLRLGREQDGPGFLPVAAAFHRFGIRPVETAQDEGNLVTTAGLARAASLLIAGGGQALSVGAVRIGVGNGSGTAAATDTDLSAASGSTNRWFQPASSITAVNDIITVVATFPTGNANFQWNEWGFDIGTPTVSAGSTVAAVLFNHKTGTGGALGTKTSAQAWAFTTTADLG